MPWNTWPYHRSGTALTFPRDEGWHRVLPGGFAHPGLDEMEWVYLNAHVREQGGDGRLFVVFAAYFTQWLRFLVVRSFDDQDRPLAVYTGTTVARRMKVSEDQLDILFEHGGGLDTWSTRLDSHDHPIPFASHLSALDDAGRFAVELDMTCTKEPYHAGGLGQLPFGRRSSFFYYSLTRLDIDGVLTLGDDQGATETVNVAGEGWYDHQWGPFYVTPFETPGREEYEWMSIQLDNGDELMLTTVWQPDGETPSLPSYGGAGRIDAGGDWQRLVGAHRWRRTQFWEDPENHDIYSAGWTFDAPEWDTHLVIRPRTPNQITPLVDAPPEGLLPALATALVGSAVNMLGAFWEGSCVVHGTVAGAPVKGVAFAELIKRYEAPEVSLDVARNDPGLTVLVWHISNPDEQVEMRHRFYLEGEDGSVLLQIDDLEVPVAVLDDPALPRGVPLVARAMTHSIDQTLTGSATRTITLR